MSLSFDRAALLLHVISEANPNKYPKLKPLHDLAMAELVGTAEEAAVELDERMMEEARARAKASAEAEAKREAQAKEAKVVEPALIPPPENPTVVERKI
jgi:hypothetical protein